MYKYRSAPWLHLYPVDEISSKRQKLFQNTTLVQPNFLIINIEKRHEGVLGSGGIAPRMLDLGTKWR
jgi:hypothetical protein